MAPIELVGFPWREAQRDVGRRRGLPALLGPSPGVAPHGIVAAVIAKSAQLLEQPDQCQAFTRHLGFVHRQQLIELLAPRADLRKRLSLSLVMKLGRLRSDYLPYDLP